MARKICESTLISLDGVFSDPHIWASEYFDDEAEAHALEALESADAMLMGRRTYEFFAASFPHRAGAYGARINGIRKLVLSNTLKKADWSNSSVLKGDVVAEVAQLKQQSGKDLMIYGHGLLGQTLLEHGLLDELKLWIHPLLLGRGRLLLREGTEAKLELVATTTLGTGVVVATYEPR